MTFDLLKKKVGDFIDVIDFVANGSFASLKENVQYLENSSPNKFAVLVRTIDFNRNWNGDYVWVDKAAFDFLKKSSLVEGDVVLCNVGSVGIVFEVPDLGVPMTLGPNSVLCRTKDINIIRQRFIYYYFLSPVGQALLDELSGGSTVQPKFNKTMLRNADIDVPDLAHQDSIIRILGCLDSKISTNAAIAKTLEDIAQTIFKSWFIDFDPVKSKMAGEKPAGMDDSTAALFPDSMEESELGLIPKGWKVLEITELGRVITGKTPSTNVAEYWGEDIPFVTIPDMHGTIVNTVTKRRLTVAGAESQKNQMLSRGSTMVSCIATPGLVVYATEPCQTNQQINSVTPKDSKISSWLYWHIRSLTSSVLLHSGVGTIFANLNKGDFGRIKSIVPTETLQLYASQVFEPLLSQIESLSRENLLLADIRDNLLPRLISGELQIPEEMLAS